MLKNCTSVKKCSIYHVHTRKQEDEWTTETLQPSPAASEVIMYIKIFGILYSFGDKLECRREPTNVQDHYAVAIVYKHRTDVDDDLDDDTPVGHLPQKVSCVCSLFIRRGSSITCEISGHRRHSLDLPQGGLEIPCLLILEGSKIEISRIKSRLHR